MNFKQLTLFSVFLHLGLYVVSAADWSYSGEHGPTNWPGLCSTGTAQSPININTQEAIKTKVTRLIFMSYSYPSIGKITNNGHTVEIKLIGNTPKIRGGNLSNVYNLEQFHFHWPAEHTVNGHSDPLEVHFVHYNSLYGNIQKAVKYPNGVAVVAVLFEVTKTDNEDMAPILNGLQLVLKWSGAHTAKVRWKMNLFRLLPKTNKAYYRYHGSLTTPECTECVIWSVFSHKVPISEKQINMFKRLETSHGPLSFNNRPTQKLGTRKVTYYSTATSCVYNIFYMLFTFILIKFFVI